MSTTNGSAEDQSGSVGRRRVQSGMCEVLGRPPRSVRNDYAANWENDELGTTPKASLLGRCEPRRRDMHLLKRNQPHRNHSSTDSTNDETSNCCYQRLYALNLHHTKGHDRPNHMHSTKASTAPSAITPFMQTTQAIVLRAFLMA